MTAKTKKCSLGRPVRICDEPATYSEKGGRLYCDRHGQAKHELRRGVRAGTHRCRHCTSRAEVRGRQENATESTTETTTEVD